MTELVRVLRPGGSVLIYVWAQEQRKDNTKSKYLKQGKTHTHNAGRGDESEKGSNLEQTHQESSSSKGKVDQNKDSYAKEISPEVETKSTDESSDRKFKKNQDSSGKSELASERTKETNNEIDRISSIELESETAISEITLTEGKENGVRNIAESNGKLETK